MVPYETSPYLNGPENQRQGHSDVEGLYLANELGTSGQILSALIKSPMYGQSSRTIKFDPERS